MKKVMAVLLLLAATLAGVLYLMSRGRAIGNLSRLRGPVGGIQEPARSEGTDIGLPASLGLKDSAFRQMTVQELLAADPRRIALSIEELRWLQRHAYPSDRELALVAMMDTRPLRGNKDPRQSTLQGLALLQQGDPAAGAALLLGAGAMGAIYAYEEGAIADHALMEQRLGKSVDLDDVLRARLEVAKVLGDHRAEWLMAKHLPSYPMPERAEHVQRHATEFLRQLGQEGQLTGMSVPGMDPRPNRDQWIRLQELVDHGASRSVEVYRLE